ncbi:MAG TPA: DUF6361 family protein, partial [Beutenbergiaceae bacterium]|nr:DUF6361 family protein [Beutenbergiaceae bacterium]
RPRQRHLDELGTGKIRDTFSEMLFPGTSTRQARARLLFVPWAWILSLPNQYPSARFQEAG